MNTNELSEKRKADRARMATLTEKLITECGANYTRIEGTPYPGPRCIMLQIRAAQGLQLSVDFDGFSVQPDVYVLSWHMASSSSAELNNATFGGSVNPHHRRKATYVAEGFDDMCRKLRSGLLMAANGTAFLAQPSAVAA